MTSYISGNKRISKTELRKALKLYGNKKVSSEEMDKIMREVRFNGKFVAVLLY